MVLEAVRAIHNGGQVASRESVHKITGLKQTVVDDRLSHLVDEGYLLRVQRGIFAPAPEHWPAREIGVYVLPCGTTKIEVGTDHVMTLSPAEHRIMGALLGGGAMQHILIAQGEQQAYQVGELLQVHRKLREDVKALEDRLTGAAGDA